MTIYNCHHKGRCNQVQYIDLSNHALNSDDSNFLQKEYLYLIKKIGKNSGSFVFNMGKSTTIIARQDKMQNGAVAKPARFLVMQLQILNDYHHLFL